MKSYVELTSLNCCQSLPNGCYPMYSSYSIAVQPMVSPFNFFNIFLDLILTISLMLGIRRDTLKVKEVLSHEHQ